MSDVTVVEADHDIQIEVGVIARIITVDIHEDGKRAKMSNIDARRARELAKALVEAAEISESRSGYRV